MEYNISILIFVFGIITWIPFFKTPYSQDQAGSAYYVDKVLNKKLTFFKDMPIYTIGHYLHLIILQFFFGKENKYFNRLMCLWCSLSSLLIYWIVYNLFGLTAAIIAGALFALYIVNPRIDGNWGPFETILALPLLASLALILQAPEADGYTLIALSGLFLGYSILIKQTAILYVPGYLLMIVGMNIPFTSLFIFIGCILVANIIPLIYYWFKGAVWEYLACNWLMMIPSAVNPKKYNEYYPKSFVRGEIRNNKIKILFKNSLSLLPIIFLTVISLISLIGSHHFSLFHLGLLLCLLSSILMVFMRGTFFPHYWLYMVPWLVILCSYSFSEMAISLRSTSSISLLQLCIIVPTFGLFIYAIYSDYGFYIPHKDPYGFIRKYNGDGFVNSNYKYPKEIGEYIKNITTPEDKILVCGWSPYIYLYSGRDTFSPDTGICLYAEDYLEIFNRPNPTFLYFLNSIYKFKNFKIIKQKENVFMSGFPEIIVFSDGKGNIKDFEKLTNICYSREEELGGYPLYKADRELTELMAFFESIENNSIQDANEYKLSDILDPQDWDSALAIAKRLLEEDPYKIEHLLTLGECLIGSENYKLLFNFYNRLIEKKMIPATSSLELLAKLGEAYCHQDKFNEAEEIFNSILKLKPDNPTVLNNLGFVYSKLNNNKKASLCFQKTLELDPDNQDAIINLEQIKTMC